jgi:hypothetical protein
MKEIQYTIYTIYTVIGLAPWIRIRVEIKSWIRTRVETKMRIPNTTSWGIEE